jgi:Plant transposon protein
MDDDDDEFTHSDSDEELYQQMVASALVVAVAAAEEEQQQKAANHRNLPRLSRRLFDHQRALECILSDYLGLNPTFDGKEFDTMFRISKPRFEAIKHDFALSGDPFYQQTKDCFRIPRATLEAKLLLPLKTFAYGVPSHTFCDYFQMSKTFARECCLRFAKCIIECYQAEYLRLPTEDDLKSITRLHKSKHKTDGLFGSLDCMHVYWKNCPVAWQGQYKGKEKKPSIVLEAISDHHLWFWHTSFGYAGTLNDLSILNLSPFTESLKNGTFSELEKRAGLVPFEIDGEMFTKLFVLVDGIYPTYSRFVKGNSNPILEEEKIFTAWQESSRKDIERAFGVLQGKFQIVAKPMNGHNLKQLSETVSCCLILHNMCVNDRVMGGNPRTRYKPDVSVDAGEDIPIEYPADNTIVARASIGIREGNDEIQQLIVRRKEWKELHDGYEHCKLAQALTRMKAKQSY